MIGDISLIEKKVQKQSSSSLDNQVLAERHPELKSDNSNGNFVYIVVIRDDCYI